MGEMSNNITVWQVPDAVAISPAETNPTAIVGHAAPNLSRRDMQAIITAFDAQSFEMASTFVWSKTAAALKKQLAVLGMEFVGEMLRRPDLNEDSDPVASIGDHEVISLAQDLGMISSTQGLKLRQSLELVTHYVRLNQHEADEEPMQIQDALSVLKTCVSAILAQPRFDAALQFADFRRKLSTMPLKPDDESIAAIKGSPYFFVRTTLSMLLSIVKTEKSANLEHAVGNTMLLVPAMWELLRAPERWQVGQAYAEVNAAGNRLASSGLKKALLDVRGFDYVPESLRSNTFTEAAARVLQAHHSFNNFYNEADPMRILANLGTAIPMPAFAKCMEATVSSWLGNAWGYAWAAQDHVRTILGSLRSTQWEYYFNECLPVDSTVISKLATEDRPALRWCELITAYPTTNLSIRHAIVPQLIRAGRGNGASAIAAVKTAARNVLGVSR